MSRRWKTITLPEEILDEVRRNMKGFTSLSEFVRAAIRYYINNQCQPTQNEKIMMEVPAVE